MPGSRRFLQRLTRIFFTIALTIPLTLTFGWFALVFGLIAIHAHFLAILAGLVPLYYAAVVVHELGHLIAGWATGFRILHVRVGPIQFPSKGGWTRPQLLNPIKHFGGQVIGTRDDSQCPIRRVAILVAAGPFASLLGIALFLGLAYTFSERIMADWPHQPWSFWQRVTLPRNRISGWFLLASITNLWLFLGSLIPAELRGRLTDGEQLLDLVWGGHKVKSRWILASLISALHKGVRPREWDRDSVLRLMAMRSGESYDSLANLYGYYYFLDCGEQERAGALLDLALAQRSGCPVILREGIFIEAAYYEGRYRKNARLARSWYYRVEHGRSEEHTRLRAEAAVLMAEGRYAESAIKVRAALHAVVRSKDPGGALAEGEWLKDLLAELEKCNQNRERPS
jgi:hypothetical protein